MPTVHLRIAVCPHVPRRKLLCSVNTRGDDFHAELVANLICAIASGASMKKDHESCKRNGKIPGQDHPISVAVNPAGRRPSPVV
jgi:hypothetical protein